MQKNAATDHVREPETQHRTTPVSFATQWIIHGLVIALLAVVVWGNLFIEHGRIEERERRQLELQTRIVQHIVEQNLADLNAVLLDIQKQAAASRDNRDFVPQLSILADALSGIRVISLYDAQGIIQASNKPELLGRDFAKREYFKTIQQAARPNTLYVSAPFRSALDAWVICIGRMIGNTAGRFDGIVNASLDPAFFAPLLQSVLFAPDMWAGLATADGSIFLEMPRHDERYGSQPQRLQGFLQTHMQNGMEKNTFIDSMLHSGVTSLVSVRAIRMTTAELNEPLFVIISRNSGFIYKDWKKSALIQNFILLSVILFSSVILLRIQKMRRETTRNERHAAEKAARRDNFIRTTMENIPAMVSYWNKDIQCEYANKPYREWFGKSAEKIQGIHARELLGDTLFAKNEAHILGVLRGEPQVFEQDRRKADGSIGHTLARYIPDKNGDAVQGFFVLVSDVTELKETQFELQKRVHELDILATTDSLTGLHNRRHFLRKAMEEVARAQRYHGNLVFLMLDVDHFKSVNDTYGHDAGDAVLRSLGKQLRQAMRETDHVGRLGGEEFGILLVETDAAEGRIAAERLRQKIGKSCVQTHAGTICYTVSIGMAAFQGERDTPLEDMLRRADGALYHAKQNGRDQVCCDGDF